MSIEGLANNLTTLPTVGCDGLDPSWENVITDTEFPVVSNTTVPVSCLPGLWSCGAAQVTCVKGTEFTSDGGSPRCCKHGGFLVCSQQFIVYLSLEHFSKEHSHTFKR